VDVDVGEQRQLGVAGIEPAHMAAKRHNATFGVILEAEVVVALRVGAEVGIVVIGRQRQGRAGTPATEHLGG